MIEVDGSHLEGGGQIIRTATALSALTGKSCKISDIRAKRANPGLRPQHLAGVRALAEICGADVKGLDVGSKELEFIPGELKPGGHEINVGTAGALSLVLQSLMIPSCHAHGDLEYEMTGGTNVRWSPPIDYIMHVTLPILKQMGYKGRIEVVKRGFYPRGGGVVKASFQDIEELKPISLLDRGDAKGVAGISLASKYLEKARVAERQLKAAEGMLSKYKPVIKREYGEADSPGSGVVLWAWTSSGCLLAADSLGERGKPAEDVGREAASGLKDVMDSGATVDEHLSDQLLPFMAMAAGKSEILAPKLTRHAETNIWVIKKFLECEFSINGKGPVRISCESSGL